MRRGFCVKIGDIMEYETLKKSYYAIIPANVRYDKNLTPNAKLLYGEITALCNEKGYCWAENRYFAELYGVSKTSISKWIKSLIDGGYINSQMIYKEGTKEVDMRYITIIQHPIEEKLNTPLTKVKDPIEEKLNTPIEEKLKDNNTIINNTINNTINNNNIIDGFFEKVWNLYPKKTNKSQIKKATKERLYKIGYNKIARCIERYKMELERNGTDYQYIKAGSTFFNGGYEDYLSDDWELPKEWTKQASRKSTTNNPFLEIAEESGIYVEGYYDKGRNNGNPFNP